MRILDRFQSLLLCCGVLVAFGGAAAEATTFIVPETGDLLAASEQVALGRVSDIRSAATGNDLRTYITLDVQEVIKGPHARTLTLVEPGGLVGEQRRWISGAPTFFVGERVLLFLKRNAQRELRTTFLGMGKFSVVRSSSGTEFAMRHLAESHVLRRQGRRLAPASAVTSLALEPFLQVLRESVGPGSAAVPAPSTTPRSGASRWQSNFTFSGPPPVRWFLPDEGQPIVYRTSSGGDADLGEDLSLQAVNAALAVWSTTGCANLNLINGGSGDPSRYNSCDGQTEITFNDPFGELDDAVGCSGVLALGGVCADSSAPQVFNSATFYRITEGDVMVNNGFGACPFWNEANLAELLTHEVGHTLGLAHSSEDPNESDPSLRDATMYYAAHFDGRGAALRSDDIAGICALYPTGRTGSVTLRRFAIISGAPTTAADDRLVVDGSLQLENSRFAATRDTLILDLRVAGASIFRLAVLPGQWQADPDNSRWVFRGRNSGARTIVVLSQSAPGGLRFRIRAHGLDLSGGQAEPVVMSLALGAVNVTQPVPALRTSARSRVYP